MRKNHLLQEYNGYRSKNAWNVALWLENHKDYAEQLNHCLQISCGDFDMAAKIMVKRYLPKYTADNYKFTNISVRQFLEKNYGQNN